MLEDNDEIRAFLTEVKQEIARKETARQNLKALRTLYLLRFIHERLERILELREIQKHNLVFIGKVGVGKTTTICHLLNLTRTVQRTMIPSNSQQTQNNERRIEITKELLSTGSGKTTICEVIIRPGNTTSLEIEPYTKEEITEFLTEFCNYLWNRVYPDESAILNIPPAELRRAIRNMLDLKEVTKSEEFTEGFTENQYEDFKRSIFENAALATRTKTKLEYYPQEDSEVEDEKRWLESIFSDLNLVKLPDFSIPKKIIVHVSPSILDFRQFPHFLSVIDTRGMDVVKDRKDIEEYIRNDDSAICIFTDSFPSAPTDVADLIGRYLSSESKDIDTKLALLVLPRKGEPEGVVGPDGPVGDREKGVALRRNDIEDTLAGQKIKFLNSNILFHDPLLHYLPDGRIDPYFGREEIESNRQLFFSQIEGIIEYRKSLLITEASNLQMIFNKIINNEDLDDDDEALIADLKHTIKQCGQLHQVNRSVTAKFVRLLRDYHVMVFRAINNRFGVYDMRDIDIYFEIKGITEELCRENLKSLKSEIDGAIQLVKKHATPMSGLQPIMDILMEQIDQYFEELVINIGKMISTLLQSDKLSPQDYDNPFWHTIQNRWGQGPGYRDEVLDMYIGNMDGLDSSFQTAIQQFWEQNFMQKILAFFGEQDE